MRTTVAALLICLWAVPAAADKADLKQTVADLASQVSDKEKMDQLGATKVELSQVRAWLNDATNAIQEEAEGKTRRLFKLVRAQMKLVDELINQSKVEQRLEQLQQSLSQVTGKLEAAKKTLESKRAELRALKLNEGK